VAGHSTGEIAVLAAGGTAVNRAGVAGVIAGEGVPPDVAGRAGTRLAGLFLAVADLVAPGIPQMAAAAGYPSAPEIPAVSCVLPRAGTQAGQHPAGLPRP
jgi:malonyl CoA-acyl carrier protein transacylase